MRTSVAQGAMVGRIAAGPPPAAEGVAPHPFSRHGPPRSASAGARPEGQSSITPNRYAAVTAAVRSVTPSFSKARRRWVLTVASPMNSSRPTSALDRPRATHPSTSHLARGQLGPDGRRPQPAGQPGHHRRREHRLASGGAPDRVGERSAGSVLEQVAAGPGLDRPHDVGVGVVGGQDQHGRAVRAPREAGRRLGAVHDRHPQVHEHHVGPQPAAQHHRLGAVGGLADHLEVALLAEHGHQAGPHDGVVVDDEQPDHRVIAAPHAQRRARCRARCRTSTAPPTSAAREPARRRGRSRRAPRRASKPRPSSVTSSTDAVWLVVVEPGHLDGRCAECRRTLASASWAVRRMTTSELAEQAPGRPTTRTSPAIPVSADTASTSRCRASARVRDWRWPGVSSATMSRASARLSAAVCSMQRQPLAHGLDVAPVQRRVGGPRERHHRGEALREGVVDLAREALALPDTPCARSAAARSACVRCSSSMVSARLSASSVSSGSTGPAPSDRASVIAEETRIADQRAGALRQGGEAHHAEPDHDRHGGPDGRAPGEQRPGLREQREGRAK